MSQTSSKKASSSSKKKHKTEGEAEESVKLSFTNWVLGGSLVTKGRSKVAVRRRNGSGVVDRVLVIDDGTGDASPPSPADKKGKKVQKSSDESKSKDSKAETNKKDTSNPPKTCENEAHCPHCPSKKKSDAKEEESDSKKDEKIAKNSCEHCAAKEKEKVKEAGETEKKESEACCSKCGTKKEPIKEKKQTDPPTCSCCGDAIHNNSTPSDKQQSKKSSKVKKDDATDFTASEDEKIISLHKQGKKAPAIAEELERDIKDVGRRIGELKKEGKFNGGKNNKAKGGSVKGDAENSSNGKEKQETNSGSKIWEDDFGAGLFAEATTNAVTQDGNDVPDDSWGNAHPTWPPTSVGGIVEGNVNAIPDWDGAVVSANNNDNGSGGQVWMNGANGNGNHNEMNNHNNNQQTNTWGNDASGPTWGNGEGTKTFSTHPNNDAQPDGNPNGNGNQSGGAGWNNYTYNQPHPHGDQSANNPSNNASHEPSVGTWDPTFLSTQPTPSLHGKLKPDHVWSQQDCSALETVVQEWYDHRWLHVQVGFHRRTGRMVDGALIETKVREDLMSSGGGGGGGGSVGQGGMNTWGGDGNGSVEHQVENTGGGKEWENWGSGGGDSGGGGGW